MTEDEAKTKWCPLASESRFGRQDEQCLASGCMAWRRTFLSQKERSAFVGRQLQLGMSSNDAYSMLNHMEEDNPSGYCGLAGAPTP
jgi:hypothetical protein